jgi:hypothetical protein
VVFYGTEAGTEPVREWLKGLTREDRRAVGQDVKTAQKTPLSDLRTVRQRLANLRKE